MQPTPPYPSRNTFRCTVCAENWPHYEQYRTCPICKYECTAMTLNTPGTENDKIMSLDEAKWQVQHRVGVGRPVPAGPDDDTPEKKFERMRVHLRNDLDRWAHTTPHWMRKR